MKGAAVFTMCEFGRLAMSIGAGNYGRNGTILRTPSMRYDGTGRGGDSRWFDGDGRWFNNGGDNATVQNLASRKHGK
jgi:hypothetical protein